MDEDAIEIFINGMNIARQHGLLYEFLLSFFNIDDVKNMSERVGGALYEWDM